MKKLKNIHPAIAFAAGILVTLIITAFVYVTACISEYKYEMYTLLPVEINYEKDGHVIERATDWLGPEIVIPMAHPEKMYFGKIESDEYIYIYQSSNANILIYPHTENSVIVSYSPYRFGFKQRYIVNYSFEYFLNELYEQTGKEGFDVKD